MSQSTYIAIDLKSFYASVECVRRGLDPLTTNLVVADASRTSKTICLAVSPTLKTYGLSGRSRLFEVEAKAREVKQRTGRELNYIVAEPRMALYMEVSADIYSVYLKYVSPEDIHVYSIDEVFMDVTGYLELYHMTARELAVTMIRDVLQTTGITATAGIAPNLYLCKVAMDIVAKHVPADADGVRIAELDERSYREQLWEHRPLTDFWRVGRGIANRLEQNGIHTMGELALTSLYREDWLYRLFGIDAEILIDHAWGYEPCTIADIHHFRPKTNCITSGQVLSCPYEAAKARIVCREMCEWLALELVDKELITDSVTLQVGYDRENVDNGSYRGTIDVDRYGRKVPKSAHGTANLGAATSSTRKITEEVLALYDRIVDPALLVRRMYLTANRVTEQQGFEQMSLFSDPVQDEKERKMQQAMLSLQKRFGKNAILKGTSLEEGATQRERNGQIGGHKA